MNDGAWSKLTPEFVETFAAKESAAGEYLAGKLERELELLRQARELLVRVCTHVDHVTEHSEATAREMACAMLSVRLINDARGVSIVIAHGYLQQAIAVATSMCDAAFALAAVAGDDALAVKWINHEDFRSSVIFTKRAIRVACTRVKYLDDVDAQFKFFWDAYQFLSSVKHGNPRLLKRLDLQNIGTEMLTVSVGPSATVAAQAVGSISLLFCHQILLLAARAQLEGFPSNPQLLADIERSREAGMSEIDALRDRQKGQSPPNPNEKPAPKVRYDSNGVVEP